MGLVCQKYSGLFRRPRGMYFSAADRGEMMSMVYNWPADQVCVYVNSLILLLAFFVRETFAYCCLSY